MSRAINCPSCGGSIEVKAAGYTVSVACRHCGSVLDVANPDVAVIAEYHQSVRQLPLPLGSRGTLFGTQWEVIGFLERQAGDYRWGEYLLFNPYAGYRWLVHSDGQWQFGTMLTDLPRETGRWGEAAWRGEVYRGEDEPVTIITARVIGEFYWRVRAGEMWVARSYERGGASLSREWREGEEVQWTHLVGVPGRLIDAFVRPQGPDLARPEPARPRPDTSQSGQLGFFARLWQEAAERRTSLWHMAMLLLVTVFAALLLLSALTSGADGVRGQGQVTVDGPTARITVGPIHLAAAHQFVTVKVAASDFTNRWVDLDYLLVNRATQATIPASATIEYYAGRDSDGSWAEGSHHTSTRFSQVPAGDYDLLVEAEAKRWNDPSAYNYTPPMPDNPWGIGGVANAAAPEAEVISLGFLVEPGGFPMGLWWLIVALAAAPWAVFYAYRASKTAVYGEDS
ncbi:DUF4178 domain-containing protein [Novosphingobium humi]|uniref:DUF4178 domain-containing protein n=1 Tax=Novosphingobium humi TaxID=2282397 RepID=UPI0025B0B28A|nr:DUF4178 domain-containing protein [Novosphingobium humi]WJS99989.1 DUF4178 domain-containing protein [Novosphingobium humi]